jgi:hypothetical protein
MSEQTISQYVLSPKDLIQELLNFAKENHTDETVPLLELLENAVESKTANASAMEAI